MGLLPVTPRLQTKKLSSSMTRGETIIILLDASVGKLHHLSGTVCHQMQSIVRAGTARAFVVATAAVLPITMVSTMVFTVPWLWLLWL